MSQNSDPPPTLLGALVQSFTSNPAVYASAIVALCALGFTIWQARQDLYYKELSIRPHLMLTLRAQNFSVALKNVGLGPAEITHIVFRLGGKCHYLAEGENLSVVPGLQKALMTYFIDDVFQGITVPLEEVTKVDRFARVGLVAPKSFIEPKQQLQIFSLADDTAAMIYRQLVKLDQERREAVLLAFQQAALKVPIGFRFCSMSGRYCRVQSIRACPFPADALPVE